MRRLEFLGLAHVAGEDARRQPLRHAILQRDGLGEIAVGQDIEDRREGFLADDFALCRHLDDCRADIIGVRARDLDPVAAVDDTAVAACLVERTLHRVEGGLVDQRADVRCVVERAADVEAADRGDQALHEIGADVLVDNQAAQRRAALAARPRRGKDRPAQRKPDIGARRDDRGVVAAEFEHGAPKAALDADADVLPHANAARRADDRDVGMVGEHRAARGIADRDLHQMIRREIIVSRRLL